MLTSSRSQGRQAIQSLEEAKDSIQAIYIGPTYIMTGSVDGHVRTYDLRKGELRCDFIGRKFQSHCYAWDQPPIQLRSIRPGDCGGGHERPSVISGHDAGLARSADGRVHGETVE